MRKHIYEIIEVSLDKSNTISNIYDYLMMVVIVFSLIPLAFKESSRFFVIIDTISVAVFIIDYLFRLLTADFKYNRSSFSSFLRYPFSFMALIDLISILPSLTFLSNGFKLLKIFRLIRAFRVFRIFKALRYSKSFLIISVVFKKSKFSLIAVGTLSITYILVCALLIFNVEPASFDTFFDAVYWATVSLTTMGYGDIYPVTTFGRVITMISSIFGIAIVALPAGIITAGYMNEIGNN
ncbi:MAG: ion transporter [Lachnospiraceae bacterium]|jgi:voltage-gated potassium channel|nr:ion transporter [Lachnospiraceae bacterium]